MATLLHPAWTGSLINIFSLASLLVHVRQASENLSCDLSDNTQVIIKTIFNTCKAVPSYKLLKNPFAVSYNFNLALLQ